MQTIERTFFCPDMDTQAAAVIIREALESTPAVLQADVSYIDRTVIVTLGDPDGEVSVRHHLASAGFPPKD